MDILILENGRMEKKMVEEQKLILIKTSIQENSGMGKNTGREFSLQLTDTSI